MKRAVLITLLCLMPLVAANAGHRHGDVAIRTNTGKVAWVAARAASAMQCVINFVERTGVHLVSIRGRGPGTVPASVHPEGWAMDLNQLRRDVTHPRIPPRVSVAAAHHCGVVSGASWHDRDNGHWNLRVAYHRYRHRGRIHYAIHPKSNKGFLSAAN